MRWKWGICWLLGSKWLLYRHLRVLLKKKGQIEVTLPFSYLKTVRHCLESFSCTANVIPQGLVARQNNWHLSRTKYIISMWWNMSIVWLLNYNRKCLYRSHFDQSNQHTPCFHLNSIMTNWQIFFQLICLATKLRWVISNEAITKYNDPYDKKLYL